MAQAFITQLTSLIAEGSFERFPKLRVVISEGGFAWLPSTMWRLDKEWKGLRREIPWVVRPPSHYIRERVRATLQPVDAPEDPRQLLQTLEQIGSDDLLLYATDYPHSHVTPAANCRLFAARHHPPAAGSHPARRYCR